MFINSVNIFKNYNTELTMGRKSFTEKIETPEALFDAAVGQALPDLRAIPIIMSRI